MIALRLWRFANVSLFTLLLHTAYSRSISLSSGDSIADHRVTIFADGTATVSYLLRDLPYIARDKH